MKRRKVVGINFDHFHMGDLLRMAFEHPEIEIAGICDVKPERMLDAIDAFSIPSDCVFTDYRRCLESTKPDLAILCPAAAHHDDWVQKVAPFGCDLLVEKPFAATLSQADRMIDAASANGCRLAINWPLVWVASHATAKRLVDEGRIGDVIEVHHYGGNRGPLWHLADKVERTAEQVEAEKPHSWFYQRSHGGGSLLDYLGYGTTLGTWYMNGRRPIEVTAIVDHPSGLEVDEHSVVVARYDSGLSKFETRWGTFTDPWKHQPQPKCGFVLVGTDGTISSDDYARSVRLQTRSYPQGQDVDSDTLLPPMHNPIAYMVDVINRDANVEGALSTKISRIGQQIVDTAVQSAKERRTVKLVS